MGQQCFHCFQSPNQKQQQKEYSSSGPRKYISKDLIKQEQLMLMLASSAKRQQFQTKYQQRFNPLNGVNYDIEYFRSKYKGYQYHLIESSQDQKMVLPKQYILNSLKKYLGMPVINFYFFYSGHGEENHRYRGDIVLQSKDGIQIRQKRLREFTISLQDIVIAWNQNKLCLQSHLYIFMDSCFSGIWCKRLSCMNQPSISIFAACDSDQEARGLKGGLFFKTILGIQSQFEENYDLLKYKQQPMFIKNSKNWSKLTKNHLKLIQMDIKNIEKFCSQTEQIEIKNFKNEQLKKDAEENNELKAKIKQLEDKVVLLQQKSNSIISTQHQIINFANDDHRLRYEGHVKDGKSEGKGLLLWKDGDAYEGEFIDGERHGRGTYYFGQNSKWSGDRYEGDWKNDKRQGRGIYYFIDGSRYQGDWKNDKRQGKGIYYYKSGARCSGEYNNGNRQGKCIYYWPDGSRLMGEWVEGKQQGRAIFYSKDQNTEIRFYMNDKHVKTIQKGNY